MTIDEAIEILTKDFKGNLWAVNSPLEAAMNLGIEALKRVGGYRHFPDRGPGELLPGETEE